LKVNKFNLNEVEIDQLNRWIEESGFSSNFLNKLEKHFEKKENFFDWVPSISNEEIDTEDLKDSFPLQYSNKVLIFDYDCWKCDKTSNIYYIGYPCGASSEDSFNPDVVRFVKGLKKKDVGRELFVGDVKERYSRTVGYSYTSFGCYYCDSIFGDFYIFNEVDFWFYPGEEPSHMIVVDLPQEVLENLYIQRIKNGIEHKKIIAEIEEEKRIKKEKERIEKEKERKRWESLTPKERYEEREFKRRERRRELRGRGYDYRSEQKVLDSFIKPELKDGDKTSAKYKLLTKEELFEMIYKEIIRGRKISTKNRSYLTVEFEYRDRLYLINLIATHEEKSIHYQDTFTGRKNNLIKKPKEFLWIILQNINNSSEVSE